MAIPMKKLYIFFEKLKKLNKVKNNIFFARQVSTKKLSNPGQSKAIQLSPLIMVEEGKGRASPLQH